MRGGMPGMKLWLPPLLQIPALAAAVAMGYSKATQEGLGLNSDAFVKGVILSVVWFGVPSILARMLLFRRGLNFARALGAATALWLVLCLWQHTFHPEMAAYEAAGNLPGVAIGMIPLLGPLLNAVSLLEHTRTSCLKPIMDFGPQLLGRIPGEAIGLMFSFCIGVLRWPPPQSQERSIAECPANDSVE
jgi:hypothetical protein